MRTSIRRGVSLVCALVLCGGCSLRMGDLQIISSKNVAVNPEPIQRGVEGKDCVHWLLGLIPLGSLVPNVEEAMDEAMQQVPEGNVLTDVAIYRDSFTVILVSRTCLRVKGDIGRLE